MRAKAFGGFIGIALVAVGALAPAATAAPGDVYVADRDADAVLKLGPGGGDAVELAQFPAASPYGMTLGPDGFLYVADETGEVWKVDRNTGAKTVVTDFGGPNPIDVAFDARGRLFMADYDEDDIFIVNLANGARTPFFTSPSSSSGFNSLAILRDGGVFISDENDEALYRFSPAGVRTTVDQNDTGETELNGADGIFLTPDERYLFVGSYAEPRYLRYDLRTGARTTVPLTVNPYSGALLPDGRILFSDANNGDLDTVPQNGGTSTPFSTDPDLMSPRDIVVEPTPCRGRIPTVVGTTGNDVIRGSAFADVISTLGGRDIVKGLGGNDIVCGGAGPDKLVGQAGNDILLGGKGKDKLKGGKGKDRLLGQAGADVLIGGKGKDKLKGGAGKDKQKQ